MYSLCPEHNNFPTEFNDLLTILTKLLQIDPYRAKQAVRSSYPDKTDSLQHYPIFKRNFCASFSESTISMAAPSP